MSFSGISRRWHGLDAFLKVLLCVVLVVSLCPPLAGAFAEESDGQDADKPEVAAQVDESAVDGEAAEGEADAQQAADNGEEAADALADEPAVDTGKTAPANSGKNAGANRAQVYDAGGAADTDGNTGDVSEPEAVDTGAAAGEPAASEESSTSSAQLDGVTMLKAKAKGIRATLLVDASAELPEGAKLVVTPLVKHEAASEADAAETGLQDEEASGGLEGSEAADVEGTILEAQQAEDEDAVAEADDEAADETDSDAAVEDEAATSEGNEATAADSEATDKPTTITGAQAALSGMTKAVQAYRAKKKAGEATVVDAYAVEVVDAEGNVVPVDDDAAKLTVTLEDGDEDAADYDRVYAVERDAEEQQSVSENAETEYTDEDAAAEEIPYQAEATDVTESAKTDEQAEETTVELDGVRSIATTTEEAEAKGEDTASETATTGSKAKASGPRKAPGSLSALPKTRSSVPEQDKLMPLEQMYDNANNGITLNLFDYDATDTASNPDNKYGAIYFRKDGNKISDINYNGNNQQYDSQTDQTKAHQLQFYSHGSIGTNHMNEFAGFDTGKWQTDYKQQYANQGIVANHLDSNGYPRINKSDGENLSYLFDLNSHAGGGKTVYPNVNRLFYVNASNHRLEYDSNEHYAQYLIDDKEFAVYKDTYERASDTRPTPKVGFFPFDKYPGKDGTRINPTSGEIDVKHHFGLTMTADFTMPLNGQITNDVVTNDPMVFEFSGDDDMWVFVDGVLVLDIGGIHQPVYGKIDFSSGDVVIDSGTHPFDRSENGFSNSTYTSDDLKDNFYRICSDTDAPTTGVRTDRAKLWGAGGIFNTDNWRAGTTHEIKVFYLERGGCDSNLKISTNIHLMTKKKASVEKEWVGTPDAKKQGVDVQLIRKATSRDGKNLVGYALVGQETLNAGNNWQASWGELPTEGYNPSGIYANYKADGTAKTKADNIYCDYEYLIREVPLAGFETTYKSGNNNLTTEKVGEMNLKAVEVSNEKAKTVVTGITVTGTSDAGSSALSPTVNLEESNYYTAGWDGLPVNTNYTSNNASFTPKQVKYRMGKDQSTTDEGAVIPADFSTVKILNEWKPTKLKVEKKWTDGNSKHSSESVYVQLKKNGQNVDSPIELKANMGNEDPWTHTFENLDPEGVYTVVEQTKSGSTYTDVTGAFTLDGKTYSLVSIEYAKPDGTKVDDLDGSETPNAGTAVITNGPVSADIVIKKVDAVETAKTLAGAVFEVRKGESWDEGSAFPQADAQFTTDAQTGTVKLEGLVPGTYWVKEITPPTGYMLREADNPFKVVVDEAGVPSVQDLSVSADDKMKPSISAKAATESAYTLQIPNLRTYALPATAGPGILELIFLGAFAMTLALGLRRRHPAGSPSAGVAPRGKRSGKPRH